MVLRGYIFNNSKHLAPLSGCCLFNITQFNTLFNIEIIRCFKIVQKPNMNQTIALKTHWSNIAKKLPAAVDHKHNLLIVKPLSLG